jgi:hypothetical protein
MIRSHAFRIALLAECIAWLAVGDVRICIIYGLMVFSACRISLPRGEKWKIQS